MSALTSGWPDRTRETDEIATSARSATSRMLARLRRTSDRLRSLIQSLQTALRCARAHPFQ